MLWGVAQISIFCNKSTLRLLDWALKDKFSSRAPHMNLEGSTASPSQFNFSLGCIPLPSLSYRFCSWQRPSTNLLHFSAYKSLCSVPPTPSHLLLHSPSHSLCSSSLVSQLFLGDTQLPPQSTGTHSFLYQDYWRDTLTLPHILLIYMLKVYPFQLWPSPNYLTPIFCALYFAWIFLHCIHHHPIWIDLILFKVYILQLERELQKDMGFCHCCSSYGLGHDCYTLDESMNEKCI